MALTLSDIQGIFKNLGKMIYIAQLAPAQSDAYRSAMMTTIREAITGSSAEFNTFTNVLGPLGGVVSAIANNIDLVPGQVKAAAENYLRAIVGPKLGLATAATLASVNAALIAAMNNVTATVPQSGTNGVNASGFAMYFYNSWGVSLPQAGSPNIADAWIEVGVV